MKKNLILGILVCMLLLVACGPQTPAPLMPTPGVNVAYVKANQEFQVKPFGYEATTLRITSTEVSTPTVEWLDSNTNTWRSVASVGHLSDNAFGVYDLYDSLMFFINVEPGGIFKINVICPGEVEVK